MTAEHFLNTGEFPIFPNADLLVQPWNEGDLERQMCV